MARTPARFTNPITSATYDWPINHNEEEDSGRVSEMTFEANSSNVGLVGTQGELQPLVLKYQGTILTEAQVIAMLGWFALCRTQTIYYTDPAGDQYEVVIASFLPRRQRVARNQRDLVNAETFIWKYTIEMAVVRVISGLWTAVPA